MKYRIEKTYISKLIPYLLIASVTMIIYSNSFTAPFTLDDFSSISNNYSIRNPFDVGAVWKFYTNRFILYYTLSINYYFHNTAVVGYHIVNVIIHILNGFIFFMILNQILNLDIFKQKIVGGYKRTVSTLAVLIFVSHPVQVNAVTYIIQRTAALAALFYFLSIFFYIKFRTANKMRYYFLCLLSILFAMFTKENTITIPFMLILIELMFFIKDEKTTWTKRTAFILGLLITVPIIPLVIKYHNLIGAYNQSDTGANFKASTSMDRLHYFYTQLNVILHYIKITFLPLNQNFDYSNDYPISITLWSNHSYISLLVHLLIFIYAAVNYRRNKLISFGILWFYMGLAVESSFISIKDVYFEHRLYFPIAGFAIFLIGLIFNEKLLKKRQKDRSADKYILDLSSDSSNYELINCRLGKIKFTSPRFGIYIFKKPLLFFGIVSIFLITFNSGLTLKRNYIFGDSIRLWDDVVKSAPGSDRAHSSLATYYLEAYEGDQEKYLEYLDKAIEEFKAALKINNNNDVAHCNLSMAYYYKTDYENSIKEARESNNLEKSTYAYRNMGLSYKKLGKIEDAINAFKEGYSIDNKCTFILKNLGDIYFETNDNGNAAFYYEEFLKNSTYEKDNEEVKKKLNEIKIKPQ